MSRSITIKQVQVHHVCSCGHNTVIQEEYKIRFADFKVVGIKIKKDRATGERFFSQHIDNLCDGSNHFEL